MAIANLIVQVRTAGANQLRNLSSGFRQAGRAGSQAAAEMRRDFDRAVVALNRANAEAAETRREFNRAPSSETARAMHMAALAARQASRNVDELADQLRQANRQAASLAGRLGAVAAAAMTLGAGMSKPMAGLIAGIIALAPVIGAALQGALLAGIGAAGLGVAIFAAFKDADIKGAWQDMFKEIGDDAKTFAKQLGPALIDSANQFRRAWRGAADFVRNLFGDLGTTIGPLTRGLIGMLREAGPGLKQAFAAAVPVLNELASMLPILGRAMSNFFSSISESKSGALKGIRVIVLALAGSLIMLGNTIEFLAKWFDFWTSAAEKVYSALGKIPVLGRPFKEFADILHGINEPTGDLDKSLRVLGGTTLAAAQASREAARAMQELHAQITSMISAALGADQANLALAAAMRAVTESVRENGHALDINTAAGHANVSAILAAVAAAEQKRQADIELAGGEKAAASAVQAANATFNAQIGQLAALMRQLGFTQAQIDALLGKYRQIAAAPNITKYIDIVVRRSGDIPKSDRAPGGPNIGFAAGTPAAPKGWAWVGEKGPELVNFRGGETVLNAQASRQRAMGGSSGRGQVAVNIAVAPGHGFAGDPETEAFLNKVRNGRIRLLVQGSRVVAA